MTKKVTSRFQTRRLPAAATVMLFLALATSCAQTPTTTPAPQTQKQETPKQAPAPVKTPQPPAKIALNSEDMGTTADLSGLKTFLKKVLNGREEQGVIRAGTDEIEKTVFVRAEPTLPLSEVVKVFETAQRAGASPLKLPVEAKAKKDDDSRPPMLLLLITVGNPQEARIGDMSDGIEVRDIYEQPAERAEKEMLLEPAIRVKIPRDGEYIINGKPVGKPASRDELQARLREASGGNPVAVIVDINPQLSYASLLELANAAFDAQAAKINLRTIVP